MAVLHRAIIVINNLLKLGAKLNAQVAVSCKELASHFITALQAKHVLFSIILMLNLMLKSRMTVRMKLLASFESNIESSYNYDGE